MGRIKNFFKHPESLVVKIGKRSRIVPSKLFLKAYFYRIHGRKLNLKDPRSYNEKLQWLKLYDHRDLYTSLVDKYEVKKIVGDIIGYEHIIPTIGVYNTFDEIDRAMLPAQFVLKCTHDSGGVIICRDKETFDWEAARRSITRSLRHNYYTNSREWPYKNVKPRIIIETYMTDEQGDDLKDYKFYTFNGQAKIVMVISDRQKKQTKANYFDMNYDLLPFSWGYPQNDPQNVPKPNGFDLMKELAEKLTFGTAELRVDFYDVNGTVYFGELTFFDGGGLEIIEPYEWDLKLGDLITLPEKRNKKPQKEPS